MAVKAGDLDSELIDTVCEQVREELPDQQAGSVESFVRRYYHWVPEEDLSDRTTADLYGAAFAIWKLARERQASEAKVHVYNPEPERDGWSSPYTAIDV